MAHGVLEGAHADGGGGGHGAAAHPVIEFFEADLAAIQIVGEALLADQQLQGQCHNAQFLGHLCGQIAATVGHNHKITHFSQSPSCLFWG